MSKSLLFHGYLKSSNFCLQNNEKKDNWENSFTYCFDKSLFEQGLQVMSYLLSAFVIFELVQIAFFF